jgi:hypothetical protein
MAASDWTVVADPEGENDDDRNRAAMVVYLTDGSIKKEIGRVGFLRANTANPDVSFEDALELVVTKGKSALKAKRMLEEFSANAGELT